MTASIAHYLKRLELWLWQNEKEISSHWLRLVWHFSRIMFSVIRDVVNGHVTLHAMGLVYTTLLSIVPFLALSFSVLKGFGVHDQLEPVLLTAMEPIGDQRFEIVEQVLSFVDNMKVGVLGSVGLGLLIYTVVSLVQKVERSFNEIWRVQNVRSMAQRFSNYLSVIMTGPLLIFAALGASAALVRSEFAIQLFSVAPLGWLLALLTKMMPYMVIIGLFTFLYTFVPNTRVKLKYAFVGGVVAGIIWQTTGLAFTKFVAGSTQYAAIYSGFAVGIVLLIWIYLAWLILLIGASFSFYAQHAQQITRARKTMASAQVDECTGLAIMYRVASDYDQKQGGSSLSKMESELSVGPEVIQRTVEKLLREKILVLTGNDRDDLVPGHPLDKIKMTDLLEVLRSPRYALPSSLRSNRPVMDVATIIDDSRRKALGDRTLLDWVRENPEDH